MTHKLTPAQHLGKHIGPLPTAPEILASMQAMHALGHPTTLASTWQELQANGIEPDQLKNLEALA